MCTLFSLGNVNVKRVGECLTTTIQILCSLSLVCVWTKCTCRSTSFTYDNTIMCDVCSILEEDQLESYDYFKLNPKRHGSTSFLCFCNIMYMQPHISKYWMHTCILQYTYMYMAASKYESTALVGSYRFILSAYRVIC